MSTRREFLLGAAAACTTTSLPDWAVRHFRLPEPERALWIESRCAVSDEDDGRLLSYELRYFAFTSQGRYVDLTPHGNVIPDALLP